MLNPLEYIDKHREEMLELWKTLVNVDSGSDYKQGIDKIASLLEEELKEANVDVNIKEFDKAGNLLMGIYNGNNNKKPIGLLGHMDTVFPLGTVMERKFHIVDGLAYGPGVIDMKGGLVCILYAIKALNHIQYDGRPIKIALAGDEEVGHKNSNADELISNYLKDCIAVFNCETGQTDNGVVVSRKGCGTFEIEVHGRAVHAGKDIEKGRSAVRESAYKIIEIENLTNFEKGITYNVGVISGGKVPNAVPDYAKIIVDVRYTQKSQEEMILKQLNEIVNKTRIEGTRSKICGGFNFEPMELIEGNNKLFQLVKETALEMGLEEPIPIKSGGASDSYLTVKKGVPTICAMGVKGEWNHSDREYAIVESLFERTKLLIRCIMKL